MDRSDFNVEKLIEEVENRPEIWDVTSAEYSDRKLRAKAWEELVKVFIDKEESTNAEKKECSRNLIRRWKSLRDCYSRELKNQRQNKSESGSKHRPEYVYFKQLSFLAKAITPKGTRDSLENLPSASPPPGRSTSPVSKKSKHVHVTVKTETGDVTADEKISSALDWSVQCKQESEMENDSDRMFLLSLLNPLKRIPEYARFQVRRKLMDVVQSELEIYCKPPAT